MGTERSIVSAFWVASARGVSVAVTEAAGGQFDGSPMVLVVAPVSEMPILLDPDVAEDIAERLLACAKLTTQRRAALHDDAAD